MQMLQIFNEFAGYETWFTGATLNEIGVYPTFAVAKRKPEKKFRLVRDSNP